MNLVFTGTTPLKVLWSGATIGPALNGTGREPKPPCCEENSSTVLYTPENLPIFWDPSPTPLPSAFTGLSTLQSVSSVLQLPQYNASVTYSRSVTFQMNGGIMRGLDLCRPNINFSLQTPSTVLSVTNLTPLAPNLQGNVNFCSGAQCPYFIYNYPDSANLDTSITKVQTLPWYYMPNPDFHQCSGVDPFLRSYGMTAQMTFKITINCNSYNLLSGICNIYCTESKENLNYCQTGYTDICFTPTTSPDIILTSDETCQDFFEKYYTDFGPTDARLENQITSYCQAKYQNVGFAGLFKDASNLFDQRLCACRMSQDWYNEFAESLRDFNPNFISYIDVTGVNQRCLVSQCAASVFTTAQIVDKNTFTCKIPACVNVLNFTNKGGIFDSVRIDQNDETCAEINKGNTPPPNPPGPNPPNPPNPPGPNPPKPPGPNPPNPKPTSSWLSRNWWWILIIVAALLLVIIVLIIVLRK